MNFTKLNFTRRAFSTAGVTTQLIVFFITFVLGVVGNILLVVTIYKRPALHRVTYYLVSALAIEDLLTLISYGVFLPQAFVLDDWYLGNLVCSIYSFLILLCGFCEFSLILVISVDRYIACCIPLRYSHLVTPRRCAAAIAFCWIFALVIALILINECELHGYDEYFKNCLIEASQTPQTQRCLIIACFLVIMPCTVAICICQWKILKQVKRVTQNTPPNVTSDTNENTSGNRPSKATITVSLMTGTFLICWIPFLMVNSSGAFIDWNQSDSLRETQYIVRRITLPIFLVSKFANPIIYGIYNCEFRTECRQVLRSLI